MAKEMTKVERAVEKLGWLALNRCPHCGFEQGHARWCADEGPLYENRRFEALAVGLPTEETDE